MGRYKRYENNKKPSTKAELYKEKKEKAFVLATRGCTIKEILIRLKISKHTLLKWAEERNVTFTDSE